MARRPLEALDGDRNGFQWGFINEKGLKSLETIWRLLMFQISWPHIMEKKNLQMENSIFNHPERMSASLG